MRIYFGDVWVLMNAFVSYLRDREKEMLSVAFMWCSDE